MTHSIVANFMFCNVDFGRITGIRCTFQEASQVAEESESFDWFSNFGILAPTGSSVPGAGRPLSEMGCLQRPDLNRCAAGPFLW